jgi:hypothetical protein
MFYKIQISNFLLTSVIIIIILLLDIHLKFDVI